MREGLSEGEIWEFYQRQGEAGDHQKEMYEASDAFANWWQNKRRTVVEALIMEHNGSSFLDVGCAEGLYVRYLSEDRKVSAGMDISYPKLMRATAHGGNADSAFFVLADACHLPFKDRSFDLVICVDVIRYLVDPVEAVKEIFRVSRKRVVIQSGTGGGKMYLLRLAFSRWFRRRHERVRTEFSSAPFEGALWYIPSRLLIRLNSYVPQDYRCTRVIGHFSSCVWLGHFLLPFKGSKRLLSTFIRSADKIDDFLAQRILGKYLGLFTTVLFEKAGH